MHALLKCSHARSFWNEAPEWLGVKRPDLHPLTWTKDILCDPMFSEADRAKLVSIMWSIWTSRNNITHDNGRLDPVQSMKLMREALALLDLPREHARIMPGYGWRPPEDDWMKINTDGSVSMEEHRGGVGGVARSCTSLHAAWCKPYAGITDPLIAEALAVRDGVLFAKLRGYDKVVVETDCLEIVNLCNSRQVLRAVAAPIIDEIWEHAPSFKSFVIQHVFRSTNFAAHLCAKQASTLEVTECWIDSTPSFLVTCLLADAAGMVDVE